MSYIPALLLTAAMSGCASSSSSAKVRYADGFDGNRARTAVLGVLRSGSLDMQTWNKLASRGTGLLRSCPPAYGETLKATRQDVFEALSDATESDLTSDLLPVLGQAARASLVLVIEVYGEAKVAGRGGNADEPVLLAHGGASSPAASDASPRFVEAARPDLEVAAILYSVEQLREVARVELQYGGPSEDEAFMEFGTQFGQAFGGLACGRWDWNAVQGTRTTDTAGLTLPGTRLVPAKGTSRK